MNKKSNKIFLKNQISTQKASGLLLIIILTSILALSMQEISTAIWQHKKIISLENIRYKENKIKYQLFKLAENKILNYSKLANIPDTITDKLDSNFNNIEISLVKKHQKFNFYDITLIINNKVLNTRKLHIYVAVCEDEKSNLQVITLNL